MSIRDTFSGGLVAAACPVQQHLVQLLFSGGLLIFDRIFELNSYKEFNKIILLLAVMHLVQIILSWLILYFEEIGYYTFRRLICLAASLLYQVVIIFALSWYTVLLWHMNERSPGHPCPGAFCMLNIYQYWIFLEIETFAANFVGIIINLASASWWGLQKQKALKIPLAMLRDEQQQLLEQ